AGAARRCRGVPAERGCRIRHRAGLLGRRWGIRGQHRAPLRRRRRVGHRGGRRQPLRRIPGVLMTARIGFIGLGNMGGRIARRLVAGGRQGFGYDHSPSAALTAGAVATGTIAEVVASSDIVFLSLPDSRVVERVVLGDGGLAESVRDGQIVVDLSTAAPESTRGIAARLAESGAAYLDAGVSGGAAAAEKGALTLMVGGDADALQSVRPELELFATQIFLIGPSGAGHTTKLLNN